MRLKIVFSLFFLNLWATVYSQELLPFVENFTKPEYNGDNQVWNVVQGNDNAIYSANNHYFGKGSGSKPGLVQNFVPLRSAPRIKGERCNVWLKWQQEPNADGYVIYFGKSPEKLYGSIMVYGKNEYYFSGLDRSDAYYFRIEAFNNNGIGPKTEIKKTE